MKLLNKLLPVATVASVACVVTPLVTSCGYKTFKYDFSDYEKIEWVDQKTGTMSVKDATKIYLEDVKDNKKILADDIAKALRGNINEDKIILSVGIGTINLSDLRITFKFTMDINSDSLKMKGTLGYEVKNLPADVTYSDGSDAWKIGSTFKSVAELKDDKKWKIITKATGDFEDEDVNKTFNYKSSDDDLKEILEQLQDQLAIDSFYLEKVQPQE